MAALYLAFPGAGVAVAARGNAPQAGSAAVDPDALYAEREDLDSARRARDLWAAEAASTRSYEASWKLARVNYWLGTTLPEGERRAALEAGVKAGEAAIAIDPKRPEGHFWMAASMGALAESFGMLQGLKYRGRIKDALERVLQIDPAWQQGSADRALGRWYDKVPGLFGGSGRKAEAHLRRSLTYNPDSTASLVFLAEVLIDEDREAEAAALLRRAIAAPPDPSWAPEDRAFKRRAQALLAHIGAGGHPPYL
jgi:tetratricopeptide (TPR) repeat protein